MKKVVTVFICAALLCAFMMPRSASAKEAGGYEITGYDVKAVISENNVYDITETISVRFFEPRHGIYLNIPINGEMTRTGSNGESITTLIPSSVSEVNVEDWDFTVQDDGKTVSIEIGSADEYVTGGQIYRISYKLKIGDDGVSSFDEVYYNIIGIGWDTAIDNVTFSVTLPKGFDTGKVGFSVGAPGVSGYDLSKLKYTIDGLTVNGSMPHLEPYEGITMRIELPEGYFAGAFKLPGWMLDIALGAFIYALLGS
jgi:hypothetical protein